ncbi:putative receptor-like protein kinase At4g00960 isoform X1 [Macadamia integrifolia]|uniref:putative receptor-like protein kinase At4g00960 isoform X1 n=1 Tax=Macadamia integrifolia TaxID=60698 RepID=UPI001C5318BD|nr:putative receptor-like protein kinase At4g00960 isoform X1 [Macadamia integrifolia]
MNSMSGCLSLSLCLSLFCTLSSIFLNLGLCLAAAISKPTYVDTYCTASRDYYTNATNIPIAENGDLLLSYLSSNASLSINNGFYSLTVGQNRDEVYGLFLCRGDVEHSTCQDCVETAVVEVRQRCAANQQAITWYEECMVKYIYSHWGASWWFPYSYRWESRNVLNPNGFNQTLINLMKSLATMATNSSSSSRIKYFATGEANFSSSEKIYGLMQCTRDLSPSDCQKCLRNATDYISITFNGSSGLGVYYLTCVARYSDRPFYSAASDPSLTGKGRNSFRTIFIIVIPVVTTVILFLIIFIFIQKRKPKSEDYVLGEITRGDTLQYDFSAVKDATNDFSDVNKLGAGGFGAVYKGKLSNGYEVAVKRLSRNSTQGEVEFENEVALVAKLQHRNLVRLLGFCLEGKLLIYEFVPNKSLDYFLFDPIKRADLNWEMRYKIIEGIARGLLYLHEDSQFKIIHRDLKPGNILLDTKMNPKISDFGLAKLVEIGQTRDKTKKIAGTIGYMAPEYAIKGRFSVKSDVYSFGVILLEILSAKRVNNFYRGEDSQNLLGYAWRLWQEGKGLEFLDPLLRDSCPTTEVLRCLLVGLLCVQGDAECRPTMSSVIWLLKQTLDTLPQPREPAFFMGRTRLQGNRTPLGSKVHSVIEVILSGFSGR